MSSAVMGLPFAGQMGVPLTSTGLGLRIWGKSLPSRPLWVREVWTAAPGSGFMAEEEVEVDVVSVFWDFEILALSFTEARRSGWDFFSDCCCRAALEPGLIHVVSGWNGDTYVG